MTKNEFECIIEELYKTVINFALENDIVVTGSIDATAHEGFSANVKLTPHE